MSKGTKDLKKEELSEKKQVLAGKMNGNGKKFNSEDAFTSKDRKKTKRAYDEDNGKEPKSIWTT
jgi:hypothetical protein